MAKILYVESRQKNIGAELNRSEIKKLPKKIFLAYSIQYKDLAISIKKQLEESNIKIDGFQQVLGCSKIKTKLPILLISTGRFHAENLFLQAPIIYTLENNKILKAKGEEIEKLKSRKKAALVKFLNADKIGILVSEKFGQENLKKAIELKKKLDGKKKAYIFISDSLDINQFENFNIDFWVNTACPGLSFDTNKIINIEDINAP
jgi:diphthamide biosynthesis enzyme Dph1/Dph2-like protein